MSPQFMTGFAFQEARTRYGNRFQCVIPFYYLQSGKDNWVFLAHAVCFAFGPVAYVYAVHILI